MGGRSPRPGSKRLTWFYPDFGSYAVKEYVAPERLAEAAKGMEHQEAARARKKAKRQPPIAEQLKAAQKEAQGHRGPEVPKRKPQTGASVRRCAYGKQRNRIGLTWK